MARNEDAIDHITSILRKGPLLSETPPERLFWEVLQHPCRILLAEVYAMP